MKHTRRKLQFQISQDPDTGARITRLTPPEQTGAFFGVYALSGVATAWLSPLLVNIGTQVTHSQQGGFASIVLLLILGLVGLMFVKGGGREVAEAPTS